jgi:hypothetical protein
MPARNVRSVAALARRSAAVSPRIPRAALAPGARPAGRRTSGKRDPPTIGLSVT